jgi:YgiT-type zinc finger domain-containing protein
VGGRLEDEENADMKCTLCGAQMSRVLSDLPFKTTDHTIVILKSLPVLQCGNCSEYLIEDSVLGRIDEILASVGGAAELEVIRYAA